MEQCHILLSYAYSSYDSVLLYGAYAYSIVLMHTGAVCGGGGGHLRALATDANALSARALTIITGGQAITRLITGALTALIWQQ